MLFLFIFRVAFLDIFKIFAFIFMGTNILMTFLSAHPRTWSANKDIPTVLSLGYGIQLAFLLIVKLLL